MIKINLIPYRAQRKKELLIQQLIIAAGPVLLALIVVGVMWYTMSSKLSAADREIVDVKQKIEQSAVQLKEIDKFKKQKEKLNKKMDIIQQLQKGKSGPVHLLDEIAMNLPGNLWLHTIKQKGMGLEIGGKSIDNISISNYMLNLNKSEYFNNVDLKKIKSDKKTGTKGVQLKDFILTSSITYEPKKPEQEKGAKDKKKKKRKKPSKS